MFLQIIDELDSLQADMTLHLPSVKTFVYSAPRFINRRTAIKAMMDEYYFQDWEYVWGEDSGRSRYWGTLHKNWINVLSKNAVPFLILEDDATQTGYFEPFLRYPSDADLVYLGGTTHGAGLTESVKLGLIECKESATVGIECSTQMWMLTGFGCTICTRHMPFCL